MSIAGKRIFLTGGGGFIGSHLCERLVENNEVVVYDNGHRNSVKYTRLFEHPNFRYIDGDILDLPKLKKALDGADIVIHLASIAGVGMVVNHPVLTLKINLIGSYNVLECVREMKVKRYIDFSTSEVYGPHVYKADENGMTTQGPIGQPRWVYAVGKLASEHLSHSYYREYGLPCVSIRPFNVYGPRQQGEGAIHHFVKNAILNEDLVVHDDGSQVRSWIYVDDFIEGVMLCLEKDEAVGHIFNLGNPRATLTVLDLAEKIIQLSGSRSKIVLKPISYPDVEVRVPSVEKARRLLGFEAKTTIDEGLKKTIAWYCKKAGELL